jgi:hypothetical protein
MRAGSFSNGSSSPGSPRHSTARRLGPLDRDVGSWQILLQKSPSELCEIEICNNRIGAPILLNRCCAFQPDLESIFLAEMLKILLQHNRHFSDLARDVRLESAKRCKADIDQDAHLATCERSAYIPDMSRQDSKRARHRQRQAALRARRSRADGPADVAVFHVEVDQRLTLAALCGPGRSSGSCRLAAVWRAERR